MDTLYMPKEFPVAVEFDQLMFNAAHLFNSSMNFKKCRHVTGKFRTISQDLILAEQGVYMVTPGLIQSMQELVVFVKGVNLSNEPKSLAELIQFILDGICTTILRFLVFVPNNKK